MTAQNAKTNETALARVEGSLEPGTLAELKEFANTFAPSALLPKHLRERPADVAITVLYGRELGLTPMQAIQGIHVIEGKPSLSAAMAVALVKRSPLCEFFELVESSAKVATYETQRKGARRPATMSFTIEEAQAAGLLAKDNWRKYPAAMLRARAALALARDVYPDVVANIISEDEADDLRGPLHIAPPPPLPFRAPPGTIEATASAAPTPAPAAAPADLAGRIAGAPTLDALEALAGELRSAPEADKAMLRAAYKARKAALGPRVAPPEPAASSPPVSKSWGDIVDAGAVETTVNEREPGSDDE